MINAAAEADMVEHAVPAAVIDALVGHDHQRFADQAAWEAHLASLGIDGRRRIVTEAALVGAITAHGLLSDTVIVSDAAGQFNVFTHALCRVGGDVATPAPHRPERADFPHSVLQERASLTAA